MNVAEPIKVCRYSNDQVLGNEVEVVQILYKLNIPHQGHEFVIVSSVSFCIDHKGPETLIFGANADGEIVDWCGLQGSERNTISHRQVLRNAGYNIGKIPFNLVVEIE